MSDLTFIGTSQARKRNSPYDIAVENGFVGTEQQYELYIHGLTVAQVVLYKRSATTPNSYSTDNGSTVTYTFSNGNISFAGSDAGWHTSPYSDNGDLYVIYASANSKDSYDTILPTEWSTPVILSEEAVAGDPGNNVCIVMIYNASSSSPTLPSQQTTFTFSTGDITGLDNNWVKTPASGDKVWISTAVAMSQGSSANIPASSWSTPVVWKEKGADGATISSIEYGVSDSSTTQPSSWSPTVPSVDKGKWLWIKTEYTNSVPASYSKTYIGTDGDDGNSIFVQSATKVGKTTTVVIVDDNGNTNTLTIVDGDDGQDGQDGINGLNGYVHIAWANSADGSVDFSTTVSEGKSYIGTYSDNTSADSQDYEDYSWSLIKGADGADGEDGTDGSVWYTGTVLTGTTTATGVAGALGDKYLNTSTSNVYECTTAGDSSTAIWTYVANIKGQPGTDGATWISGTTLSGQTTATGVAGALGDMYINTSTDNVYECTTAGDSSTAIWTYRMNIKGNPGTDANVIDFTASGLTYVKNLRVPATDNSGFTDITITVDLQGSYSSGTLSTKYISGISFEDADIIYSKNGTAYSSGQHSVSVVNGDIVVIRILYTQSNQFIIQLVSSSDTVEKTINPIDETEHDHDWGVCTDLPVSFNDRSGNLCTPLDGDYFVSGRDFDPSPTVATPQIGDVPKELHWDERSGSGTSQDPYIYTETTDSEVDSQKTYYIVKYKKGIAFIRTNGSWDEMIASASNSERMLNALGNVLSQPNINPSTGSLYAWIGNLAALNAIIDKLTANEAFIKRLKAVEALFENIRVTGKSEFNGSITSTALTTTLEDNTPGTTFSLELGSTAYWNSDDFIESLTNTFYYPNYYDLQNGSTYSKLRKKGTNLLITSGTTIIDDYEFNPVLYTSTMTQRIRINGPTKKNSILRIIVSRIIDSRGNQQAMYDVSLRNNQSQIFDVQAGDIFKILGYSGVPGDAYYTDELNYSLYDVDDDYSDITFFDSNGNSHTFTGYRTDTPLVVKYQDVTYTPTSLYKWTGMSSDVGSKTTNTSSLAYVVGESFVYIPQNTIIKKISWSSRDYASLTDTNGNNYTLSTNVYYAAMNISLTPIASVDNVETVDINPKTKDVYNIGDVAKMWNEIWSNKHLGNVNGDPVYGVDSRASDFRVFGAVFN